MKLTVFNQVVSRGPSDRPQRLGQIYVDLAKVVSVYETHADGQVWVTLDFGSPMGTPSIKVSNPLADVLKAAQS